MSSSRWKHSAEALALPLLALAAGLGLFGVFVWLHGHNPLQAWTLLFLGAFGDPKCCSYPGAESLGGGVGRPI